MKRLRRGVALFLILAAISGAPAAYASGGVPIGEDKGMAATVTEMEEVEQVLAEARASDFRSGAPMPTPVPDPVVSGYFTFESRGHRISMGEAVADLERWASAANLPDGAQIEFVSYDSASAPIGTGDNILITYANGFSTRYAAVVRGDVVGTGIPGLSQLVALSRLLATGNADQYREAAADVNADGKVTLSDLVRLAEYLTSPDPGGPVLTGDPQIFPRRSSNIYLEDYSSHGRTVTSHLCAEPDGSLTRVEFTGGRVVVERYDQDFWVTFTQSAAPELPIWGGFYSGNDAYYLIFGQMNGNEIPTREVIRVVKYDKNWNRLGAASLVGANTTEPFKSGSLRCDEYGGYLYVRTCHTMYKTFDGLRHQANMMFSLRESDMQITDAQYSVSIVNAGYVSHSFNQFIQIDQRGNIFTIDQGDAYPRGAVFMHYAAPAGEPLFIDPSVYHGIVRYDVFQEFPGEIGDNVTGASIGGFQLTGNGCLCTYNFNTSGKSGPRDVYVFTRNTNTGESTIRQLTHGANATTPQAASLDSGAGYIMWIERKDDGDYDFRYAGYGADGNVGAAKTGDGLSSDCQPIAWEDGLVWYVTSSNSEPAFFVLDSSGVQGYLSQGGPQAA